MTNYELTEEQRRLLTEKLLGECWHEPGWFCQSCNEVKIPQKVTYHEYCEDCGDKLSESSNRTFDTPADAHAVMLALEKEDLWSEFYTFVERLDEAPIPKHYLDFWLHSDKERFCCLAGRFMEEYK